MSPGGVAFVTRRMTPQISIRFDDDQLEEIDTYAENEGVTRSQYIRDAVGAHEQLADCRRENERLRRERRQILDQREERNELVRYAESEREAAERREQRRHANILRRTWWKLAGTPDDETEA